MGLKILCRNYILTKLKRNLFFLKNVYFGKVNYGIHQSMTEKYLCLKDYIP